MVIDCLSALCTREIPFAVKGCFSALLRACAYTHYFVHYLTVTVKMHTLRSYVNVELAGSLLLGDSL